MSSSLNAILSVAKTGILSHQLALQVSSHNLANATTEGYSRQRAELVPGRPVLLPQGLLGTGVRVADISRARDSLLDTVYRREAAVFHGLATRGDALSAVESALGEPGPFSLGASLDAFFNSWSDLSNDPTSTSGRVAVVSAGQQLVDHFHRIEAALGSLTSETVERLGSSVVEVNRLLAEVADVNRDIAESGAFGVSAPDLEDRRDMLLDELATYVPIEVTPRSTGGVGVSINGVSVVEGITSQTLSLSSPGGVWTVQTGSGLSLGPLSGKIGGGLDVLNTDFVAIRSDLDQLAQGLVERVNAAHVTGTNPLGGTGIAFFDDFGSLPSVNASNISLDAAILADSQAISAGTPDGGGNYRAGANDIALAISALRSSGTGGVLGSVTIGDAHRDLAAGLGLSVASTRSSQDTHAVLLASARDRRESVSGVATDEELIKVVQIQAAFTAASRLVSVVDEMYQTILSI